jgi:hypothetical protein
MTHVDYGQPNDPMVGAFIGGVNAFGGGLALYDSTGQLLGGLGVSGDTSCTDHIVAWRVREFLGLGNVPGGVGGDNTDNLNIADPVTPIGDFPKVLNRDFFEVNRGLVRPLQGILRPKQRSLRLPRSRRADPTRASDAAT